MYPKASYFMSTTIITKYKNVIGRFSVLFYRIVFSIAALWRFKNYSQFYKDMHIVDFSSLLDINVFSCLCKLYFNL
jgi:hypothetical protein